MVLLIVQPADGPLADGLLIHLILAAQIVLRAHDGGVHILHADAVDAAMTCPYALRMFEEPDDLASAVNVSMQRDELRSKLEKVLVEEVVTYKQYKRCQLMNLLIHATRVNTRFHLDGMVDEAIELDYISKSKVKCSTGLLIEILKELLLR